MATLTFKNAKFLVTMDERGTILRDASICIEDNIIKHIGKVDEADGNADIVIDASDMIILPGLINTHHHLFQNLTRCLPQVQNSSLFPWLTHLYDIWAELDPEMIYVSSLVGFVELIQSGCTTTSDQLYVIPHGQISFFDKEIEAGREIGIRLHLCRGSMSLGRKTGGLPPDEIVETQEQIIQDSQRLLLSAHDPSDYAMIKVDLGCCSPFSVSQESLRSMRQLAKEFNTQCHMHLAESQEETDFCIKRYGKRPLEYAADNDWLGPDVWFAHAIYLNDEEIRKLADSDTGIAYCPTSNMRLGQGIAPISKMMQAGIKVGVGVDGSASNDSSNLLNELRMGMLLQRVKYGANAMNVMQALRMGTSLGAKVLGRKDVGSLEVGKAADLIAINLDRAEYSGAFHDPVAGLVFCGPVKVDYSVINGRIVIENGRVKGQDIPRLVKWHNKLAMKLATKALGACASRRK